MLTFVSIGLTLGMYGFIYLWDRHRARKGKRDNTSTADYFGVDARM